MRLIHSHRRWRRLLPAAVLAMGVGAAWSQASLDPALIKAYSGVYAQDCTRVGALRLKFLGDSLVVEQGGKSAIGKNVQSAYSFLGQSPPADFQVALLSSAGDDLQFVLFHNRSGLFAELGGGPKVVAVAGKAAMGKRYRHCDPNRNALPGAPAAAPGTPSAQAAAGPVGPTTLLRDPQFRRAHVSALGPLAREPWLARLDGPAPPLKNVKVAGTEYQLISVCKSHDCGDNNAVLLYSARRPMVYGKVFQRGRATLVGAPPPAVAAELEKLWVAEWRRKN